MKRMQTSNTEFKLAVLCLVLISLTFCPIMAMASGGEGHGDSGAVMKDFIMRIINFSILAGLMIYFGRKPLKSFLINRSEEIASALKKAEEMQAAAQEKYNEYKQKLDSLDKEIESIVTDFKADGEKEKDRIIERAKVEGEKIKKQAELTAESEIKKAKAILQNEVAEMAVKLAEDLLTKQIGADDQKKLIQEYLSRIGEVQ